MTISLVVTQTKPSIFDDKDTALPDPPCPQAASPTRLIAASTSDLLFWMTYLLWPHSLWYKPFSLKLTLVIVTMDQSPAICHSASCNSFVTLDIESFFNSQPVASQPSFDPA
ncbi:hypothetical protein F2Q70_00002126 [Brassica cretica]|uniref:Uncharacterized protein n=1 Tax=Brassica cretica TaxID=69181 RepID=A0A8S9IK83_BRACR|nr:hypothetical protein F2Q70_00002126 [Brassica cretica]